ncbi:MAG: hypothetical protein IT285_09795 [Bdellovibrionales bacterium]|nr:hypothetical protein [Bdellovibrionales bacterium]
MTPARRTLRPLARIAVNGLLVFHLLVMALVPNQQLYVPQEIAVPMIAYANILGMNVAWKFFAPDPAPPIYYEFEVTLPPRPGEKEPRRERMHLPALRNDEFWRQNYNRRVALKNTVLQHPKLISQVVVPRMVCTRFPEARDVAVTRIGVRFPSLKEIREGRGLNDMEDRRTYTLLSHEVCLTEGKP